MTVHIVFKGDHDGDTVLGVFSDVAKALDACRAAQDADTDDVPCAYWTEQHEVTE